MFDKQKIAFIGCGPRSGSTLLTRILDSHSKIASPCEIALPQYFVGDRKEQLVNNKYNEICNYYNVNYNESVAAPQLLFDAILSTENKEYIVLKDPRQSLFIPKIHSDYPNANFVLLVRDVRSVAMSVMFTGKRINGFKRWYEYNINVLNAFKKIDEKQSHIIRYEDIVDKPEITIEKLVTHLGYNFEPTMLDYGSFSHADDSMKLWGGATGTSPLTTSLAPDKSPLQSQLDSGAINDKARWSAGNYDNEVIEIYNSNKQVKDLNNYFGYIDS